MPSDPAAKDLLAKASFEFTKVFEYRRGNSPSKMTWDDCHPKQREFGLELAAYLIEELERKGFRIIRLV